MEHRTLNTFGDYMAIARRRRGLLIVFCPLIMLLAVLLAIKLPAIYRSSGTIMLESSSVPEDLIRSTVASYADQQIELVRRRVMTTDRLAELVREIDPYPELTELSDREKAQLVAQNTSIERVDPITLEPLLESTAFSIHFTNPSPLIASDVATAIVDLFLTDSLESRTESATDTYSFLSEQAIRLEGNIAEAESALSAFKREHAGTLPDSQGLNQNLLDRAERDLVDYDRRIREAEQQQALLRLQLSQTPPSLVVAAADWRTELASLQLQLAEARQRYTPEHPDIRRLQRAIQALNDRAASNGNVGIAPAPDNPAYLELEEQANAAGREARALRSERANLRQQIDEYARRLYVAPEIEREYLSLTRDYDIAQTQYREIKQKLSDAERAVSLETQQRGERFTLIRPPYPPGSPYSPNRLGIVLLGLVLAFGGGIGLAAIAEASDSTIRGARDLKEVLDTPPLGAVPFISNRTDRRKQRLRWVAAGALFLSVALIGATL